MFITLAPVCMYCFFGVYGFGVKDLAPVSVSNNFLLTVQAKEDIRIKKEKLQNKSHFETQARHFVICKKVGKIQVY